MKNTDNPTGCSPVVEAQGLRREDFNASRVAGFAEIALRAGISVTTEAERQASLAATLRSCVEGEDAWVFGYGSLMWNPALEICESRVATVYGFHRRFCLDQQFGRGSPERPGVMLALDRGGSCTGVVHRIAASRVKAEMEILWLREMPSGAYNPRWLQVQTEAGPVRAVTFVMNRDHPRYLSDLTLHEIVERLATAAGQSGTNLDYLERTVASMTALSISSRSLCRLLELARGRNSGATNE